MEILSPQPNRRRGSGIGGDHRNIDATPASIIAPLTSRSRIVEGRKVGAKQMLSLHPRSRWGENEKDSLGLETDESKASMSSLMANEGFIVDFVDVRCRVRSGVAYNQA